MQCETSQNAFCGVSIHFEGQKGDVVFGTGGVAPIFEVVQHAVDGRLQVLVAVTLDRLIQPHFSE